MNIFIDTEIWSIAQKKPIRKKFSRHEDYKKALDIHNKAKMFIKNALQHHTIYMSYHQIAEIYHVLGFRGSKLPHDYVQKFILAILASKRIIKVPVAFSHILKSLELSTRSGIHIWDFLCIVPIAEHLDIGYSIDKHFQHPVFMELEVKIENPLGTWIST